MKHRCDWATNDLNIPYHDAEWGLPVHDEHRLFEFLTLEGAQAGLSWDTILAKRDRYRSVFANFDPKAVARFSTAKLEKLLQDPGIIRNRMKVYGTVQNAKAFLAVQKKFGSFDTYVWGFEDASAMSKDLKKRGFTFVGPTICHAFMQATGMRNDHIPECFRHAQLAKRKRS
ncbi:MAG: DNA-3-methyladenine glycosylase I [Candidatus Eremiobacteraeota bacterium]|nr:DNA-3-methyladenine glycosylase I [Candidatus Eremiobacteraeota bacterium]